MYLALGIVFFVFALGMGTVLVLTALRHKKNTGDFITKKNLFYLAPAFLLAYGIMLTASAYNGETLDFFYCFSLIKETLDVFKFSLSGTFAGPICQAYPIFYADFVLSIVLGILTAILSVASFFSRRIANAFAVHRLLRGDCDVLLGDSPDTLQYLKNTPQSVLFAVNVSSQRYADLLKLRLPLIRCRLDKDVLSRHLRRGNHNVIVFRDAKLAYSKIFDVFNDLDTGSDLKLHLEANQAEIKILKDKFLSKANHNTRLFATGFSKYELMARRFVTDHPITKYIPRNFYNDNFSIKSDKEINVVFVGFGKVNYSLFRMCATQFQFAQEVNGKLQSKPVHYHVYDRQDPALHNDFFTRILYEFDDVFADCDFPKPEKICELDLHRLDTNSIDAKKEFKTYVSQNSYTYFVISMEDDLEDASYAQTLKRLLGDKENYRIFVRAKNVKDERLNETDEKVVFFGDDKKLFTHDYIVNDGLAEIAQRLNLLYNEVSESPDWLASLKAQKDASAAEQNQVLNKALSCAQNREYMLRMWSVLPNIEQDSNLYHALNMPFKLNMLGFEMIKSNVGEQEGVDESEFNLRYKNSGRDSSYEDYSFFFKNESSNVLAYIEHSRWNALYILYDYKQMKKKDLHVAEKPDGAGSKKRYVIRKDPVRKEHACLTTYYGLDEVVRCQYELLYGQKVNPTNFANDMRLKELSNVYAYDYMDLDRLYSQIIASGYKLVYNKHSK